MSRREVELALHKDGLSRPEIPQIRTFEPPDGGLRAWLAVFGSFFATTCMVGYINSFGVYQTYYSTHFLTEHSESDISWIGSLQISLLYLGGAISGPLADCHGVTVVVVPACVTMVFSVIMTSFSTKYYQFLLAQGFTAGIASGMMFAPAVSTPGQYFSRRRAFAMGIASSGAPFGGVVFPIILGRLLNHSTIGFGWTLRIIGAIMALLLTFTCLFLKEIAPRRKGQLFIPSAFKNIPYVTANIASILVALGLFTPIFYISSYSVRHGMSLQFAFYQISILNFASIFGRTMIGYIADKFGRFNMILLSMVSTAVLLFCWTTADSVATITVFSVFFGFVSGPVISLYPACIAQTTPSLSDIGTYVGMGMASVSFAALSGTPIYGALVHTYNSYNQAAIFSGAVVAAGSCFMLVSRLTIKRDPIAVV